LDYDPLSEESKAGNAMIWEGEAPAEPGYIERASARQEPRPPWPVTRISLANSMRGTHDAFDGGHHMLSKRVQRWMLTLIALLPILCWICQAPAQSAPPAPLKFDTTGAQVGEQLPNLTIYDLDGKPGHLDSVWSYRTGVLLLTSSLSCPKSRASYPRAEELADKLDANLPVEIIYVLEAHPKTDPSPYRGYEDLTAENRRDGILCRQPKTLDERLKLANQFKLRLHVKPTIHVDGMDNAVWSALGGGPNMGVLLDNRGIVIARQGWFDAPSMQKAIDAFAAKAKEQRPSEMQTTQDKAMDSQLRAAKIEPWLAAREFEKPDPAAAFDLLKRFPELAKYTTEAGRFTHGESILALAAKGGNVHLVETLIEKGADVNGQNVASASPLHFAAKAGNVAVVKLLIEHGADVNLKAAAGPTPLQEAAIYGHRDVVDLLLKEGAKTNLFSNAAMGNVDAVRKALDADLTRGQRPDGWSRTLLDYAAATGQVAVMKLLYSYGVKDDQPALQYVSDPASFWAARQKQIASVEFLLNSGDDPNTRGMYSDTLMHVAAGRNDSELARLVLRMKPNLQLEDIGGDAPLHDAVMSKSYDVAALLLDAGADPNMGQGPMLGPCAPGPDSQSLETALQFAAEMPDIQMAGLLLSHGAAINARDRSGRTALHHAVSAGDEATAAQRLDTVRFLLAHGADANAKDSEGRTPLDVTNHEALRPILKEHGAKSGVPADAQ
jgi:ankyrin repeat protein